MGNSKKILMGSFLLILFAGIAYGQNYLINETFGTVPPSGWTNGAVAPTSGTSGYDDSANLTFDENKTGSAVSIVTSAVTDPDRVEFWYSASSNAYSGTFTVEYSTSSTGPWTPWVSVGTASLSYAQSATEFPGGVGTYYFQLQRTGSSGNRKDLYIDVFQVTQSIAVSTGSLTGFLYEPSNGPSTEQTFSVSGSDLTADLVLTAPTNYEISKSTGSGFTSDTLIFPQYSGTVSSKTVYVRLKSGLSTAAYNNETITISSTNKFSKSVICSGDVRDAITISTVSLSNFNYDPGSGPSSEQSFTVSGQDLIANISISAPTDYEVSTTSGSGFGSNVSLVPSGGIVNTTTVYVRLKAGLSQGTYNNENMSISSTGKVSKTLACSGFVGPLVLNIKVFVEGSLW